MVVDHVAVGERPDGLSARERELVDAVAVGDVLECSRLPRDQLAATEDPEHIIRAEVLRDLLLKRYATLLDPRGIRLRGARITGTLDLTHLSAPVGVELRDCCVDQTVLLHDAHLPWLTLSGSCVPALSGNGLRVDGDLFLRDGFRATGDGEMGTVRLLGAHVGGQLDLSGAELANSGGPALHGDRLRVDGSLFLRKGFRATGDGEMGTVRLVGAHIGSQLDLSGAELANPAGPALSGGGLQVDGSLFLRKGFRATGDGEMGTVRLVGAHIGSALDLSGAELANSGGPALHGDRLRVDGSLFLRKGFRATGDGEMGTVRLVGAHIGSQLNLSGAELANRDGLILNLEQAEAKRILLPARVICPREVAGTAACAHATRRVDLTGFVYTAHGGDWRRWLHLVARHTGAYRPQPYQQLAAVQRAAGHDSAARQILIAQQHDLRARGQIGGWWPRTLHTLWGLLGGYGYRIGRIALILLLVSVTAGGLGVLAGHVPTSPGRYVAMRTPQTAAPDTPCSMIEQIGVGIDRGLPLPTTGIRSRCDFDTTSRRGQLITAASWILQALVWALATLVVAGYSGLIRKAT